MRSSAIRIEPSDSRRLLVAAASDGTRGIRFRMGGNWFTTPFLAVWLCGWAFGEVMVVGSLLGLLPQQLGGQTGFLLIWLVLWTIGGLGAASYLMWTLFGREEIEVDLARLKHAYRLLGLAHVRAFEPSKIGTVRFDERRGSRSSRTALALDYGTRTIRVFHGIEGAEAKKVVEVVELALGPRGRR